MGHSFNSSTLEAEAEISEFQVSQGYTVKPCLKIAKTKPNKKEPLLLTLPNHSLTHSNQLQALCNTCDTLNFFFFFFF